MVAVAWAGQKRLTVGERIGPAGGLWWNVGVALGIHGVDPLDACVKRGPARSARPRRSLGAWCVVGYHPLVVKSDGSAGAGGRSTAGVGIKSACSQWSVGRSGLGCLLTAM